MRYGDLVKRARRIAGFGAFFLALWFAFEMFVSWSAFCNNPGNYGGSYQAPEEYSCVFRGPIVSLIRAFAGWWRHVFHQPDAYVALFTAVLAISTWLLWLSTREAARAAKAAADALPIVERGYVFVVPDPLEYWDPISNKAETKVYSSRIGHHFKLWNHGKTPVIVSSIDAQLRVWSDAPDNTQHIPSTISAERILASGEDWYPDNSPYPVDEATAGGIEEHRAFIWFYGSILYQDMFGRDHATRFRYRWSEVFKIFNPVGGPPHNERT